MLLGVDELVLSGMPTENFANIVSKYKPGCVVLNACRSHQVARAICRKDSYITVICWSSDVHTAVCEQLAKEYYTGMGTTGGF